MIHELYSAPNTFDMVFFLLVKNFG